MIESLKLREDWLRRVGEAMASTIEKAAGAPLPKWRAACGFTSKGKRSRAIGECWNAAASKDEHAEIFIAPKVDSAREAASTLAHELIHACLPMAKHGKPFQKAALAIGFTGPFKSTPETEAFWAWVDPILEAVGPYPHAELLTARAIGAPKPQKNRMVKVTCGECGYTARVARKWLMLGAPHCPEHGEMVCEAASGEDAEPISEAA